MYFNFINFISNLARYNELKLRKYFYRIQLKSWNIFIRIFTGMGLPLGLTFKGKNIIYKTIS